MFRRDPVAIVLGKDIAQVVHQMIHRQALNELVAEYHKRVACHGLLKVLITFDGIVYNFRHLESGQLLCRGILNHTKVKNALKIRASPYSVQSAFLPKNY